MTAPVGTLYMWHMQQDALYSALPRSSIWLFSRGLERRARSVHHRPEC